ncbi:hypothetical protein DPMN_087701 [Dreissena polymorpha]|uniref:Uncharacterized protein n=2 Tax=Dreissena polymorpha TaxID=45954 RepID=A0A9D4KT58_DREPO|nr:hypothetical protein DPMN_087701 [Dreissena polymorpha]
MWADGLGTKTNPKTSPEQSVDILGLEIQAMFALLILVVVPVCLAQFDPNALNQNFGKDGFGGQTANSTGAFDPNKANAGFGSGFESGSGFNTGGDGGFGGSGTGSTSGSTSGSGSGSGSGTFDPNQFISGGGTSGTFDPNALNNFGGSNSTLFGRR